MRPSSSGKFKLIRNRMTALPSRYGYLLLGFKGLRLDSLISFLVSSFISGFPRWWGSPPEDNFRPWLEVRLVSPFLSLLTVFFFCMIFLKRKNQNHAVMP
jgi:hypothetical protein